MAIKIKANREVHYFKRSQRGNIFHYYEVIGGPGHTVGGKQIVINFLNDFPIIAVEHNYETDPSGLTGTWCQFEVGIPITKEEYLLQYKKATDHPNVRIL